MIRMKDILLENIKENRVSLVKLQTILEKIVPELTDTQAKGLMEIFSELTMFSSAMNSLPYTVKEYKLNEWQLVVASFNAKLLEMKQEVTKLSENDKINCNSLMKAIDELLLQ
jgi:biotin-(acetyl-CoA carboxylase) ligase